MKKRYYLHGDQSEGDTQEWYCARCDAFVRSEHFRSEKHAESGEHDYARYDDGLKRLKVTLRNLGDDYYRSADSENYFA